MEYFTAHFHVADESVFVLHKKQFLFVCLLWGDLRLSKQLEDYQSELEKIARWKVEKIRRHFEKFWNPYMTERTNMACVFLKDSKGFYAWCGEGQIKFLNQCLGKMVLRNLTFEAEGMDTCEIEVEPGVGLVLGDNAFFDNVTNMQLVQSLGAFSHWGALQAKRYMEALEQSVAKGRAAFIGAPIFDEEETGNLLLSKGYQIGQLLGCGAFGHVYDCTDLNSGKHVVCKAVQGGLHREILRKEGDLQKRISYPAFAKQIDFFEGENISILVMEYRKGKPLTGWLKKRIWTKRKRCVALRKIAEGLLYLHKLSEPVVFRDLKPDNILLDWRGGITILDLGCAGSVEALGEAYAGNQAFSAPEQFDKSLGAVGPYSDVYAWGKLAKYLLQGRKIDADLIGLLEQCTQTDYRKRVKSMEEVLNRFKRFC